MHVCKNSSHLPGPHQLRGQQGGLLGATFSLLPPAERLGLQLLATHTPAVERTSVRCLRHRL